MKNISQNQNTLMKGSYGVFDIVTELEIKHAIKTTIDENVKIGDIGNEPLFRLGQYVKPIIPPSESLADVWEPFIKEFYHQHEGLKERYEFLEVMLFWEDIWDNDKINHPKIDYFKIALMRADKMTEVRPEPQWCKDSFLLRLDNYCYQLQKIRGKLPIYVSQYQAGKIINKEPRVGRRALDKIEKKENLHRHKTGDFKKCEANEYFYIGQAQPVKKPMPQTEIKKRQQMMIEDLRRDEEEQ